MFDDLNAGVSDYCSRASVVTPVNINLLDFFGIVQLNKSIRVSTDFNWYPGKYLALYKGQNNAEAVTTRALDNARTLFKDGYEIGYDLQHLVNTFLHTNGHSITKVKPVLLNTYMNQWLDQNH